MCYHSHTPSLSWNVLALSVCRPPPLNYKLAGANYALHCANPAVAWKKIIVLSADFLLLHTTDSRFALGVIQTITSEKLFIIFRECVKLMDSVVWIAGEILKSVLDSDAEAPVPPPWASDSLMIWEIATYISHWEGHPQSDDDISDRRKLQFWPTDCWMNE